jgi:hypothetical protein
MEMVFLDFYHLKSGKVASVMYHTISPNRQWPVWTFQPHTAEHIGYPGPKWEERLEVPHLLYLCNYACIQLFHAGVYRLLTFLLGSLVHILGVRCNYSLNTLEHRIYLPLTLYDENDGILASKKTRIFKSPKLHELSNCYNIGKQNRNELEIYMWSKT